jgi:hypothetical protein
VIHDHPHSRGYVIVPKSGNGLKLPIVIDTKIPRLQPGNKDSVGIGHPDRQDYQTGTHRDGALANRAKHREIRSRALWIPTRSAQRHNANRNAGITGLPESQS